MPTAYRWEYSITNGAMMKSVKAVSALLLGGISFWMPTVAIEMTTQRELNPLVGTIVPFAAVLSAYFLIRWAQPSLLTSWTSIWMLCGIYLLGPTMMLIAWTSRGAPGGFGPVNLVIASLVPLFTLYMAGPDVTVFGVLLATVALTLVHFALDRKGSVSPRPDQVRAPSTPSGPQAS
jgi:hypothetical protein